MADTVGRDPLSAFGGVTVNLVQEIAREAGAMVRSHFFEREKIVDTKDSPADLVTEIDKEVENKLKERISAAFPEHRFLCEESCALDERLTDAPTWVIDPIDGTTNFVHTLPFTCVSIAFVVKKETLLGVVYAPILDEMFTAEKGKGAFLNGQRISTSGREDPSCSVICCGFSVGTIRKIDMRDCDPVARTMASDVKRKTDQVVVTACLVEFVPYRPMVKISKGCVLNNLVYCMHHCRDIRHLGSTALELCYVAAGRLDAYQSLGPKEWDFAAAVLMVKEAGGCVIDFDGQPLELHKRRALAGSTDALARSFVGHLMAPGLLPLTAVALFETAPKVEPGIGV